MAAPRWPIEDVKLDELVLDLENVRIPDSYRHQTAIANYMVEAEDVLDLVRDILRDGYLDNELPVIVDEDGRRVVLEGNRRITALKAIRSPDFLGASASRMERLLSRYPDADKPSQVRVMIAPSREAAQPLLARLHTRNPKKSWLREQQAMFYHAQLSPTVSVDDLRAGYPVDASKITKFIRMGEMRNLIRDLDYEDPKLEEFVKTSRLKMTSFEYAYEKPKIQKALGLSFTKDGLLESRRISEGQRRGLIYLLGRIQDGTLDTRSPELKSRNADHDSFAEFLRKVVTGEADIGVQAHRDGARGNGQPPAAGAMRSGGAHAGSGTNGENSPGATSAAAPSGQGTGSGGTSQAGSRGPNRGETLARLNMNGFEYKGSSDGLRRRFEELRRIDVRDLPNAAIDLLRTVLECAIKDHFRAKGRPVPPGKMLSYCIDELAKAYQSDQRMTTLINSVNRRGRLPASQFAGTETALNASNHEPDAFVTGPGAHEAWERIKPILIEIVGK